MKKSDLVRDYKQKPKEVVQDYVLNAVFAKSKHENKSEQIITKDIQEEVVVMFIDDHSIAEDLQTKWKVTKKNNTGFPSTGLSLWRWYEWLSCTKHIIDLS